VGVLTRANVQLIPPHYRSVPVHGTQYVVCRAQDSLLTSGPYQGARAVRSFYGLFSATGQPLTKFDYRVIGDFHKGRALARVGDRVGFLEPGGRLVIPARWSVVEAFDQSRALVSVQQRWGAIDPRGRVVIKPRYTYAQVQAKLVAERLRATRTR
jgi:hypothetical protein